MSLRLSVAMSPQHEMAKHNGSLNLSLILHVYLISSPSHHVAREKFNSNRQKQPPAAVIDA
jgi:hypothetical protein